MAHCSATKFLHRIRYKSLAFSSRQDILATAASSTTILRNVDFGRPFQSSASQAMESFRRSVWPITLLLLQSSRLKSLAIDFHCLPLLDIEFSGCDIDSDLQKNVALPTMDAPVQQN